MITFDQIPEHKDAAKWSDELLKPGQIIETENGAAAVVRSKVFSAFWFTKECLIAGGEVDPAIISGQHSKCGTVLFAMEVKKIVDIAADIS
jgi:hypothetical protein